MERTIPLGAGAELTITRHDNGTWTLTHTVAGQADLHLTFDNDIQARDSITRLLAAAMRPAIDLDAAR